MKNKTFYALVFMLTFGFIYALLTLSLSGGDIDETVIQFNFGFIISLLFLIYLEIKK